MWVRIDELSFPAEHAQDVIDHVRNHAVVRHNGAGLVGFRLLVDRENGHALDVSYWDDLAGARADQRGPMTEPATNGEPTVLRTDVYELAIDSV